MRDVIVETVQELTNDRLHDRFFVVFSRERFDRVDRVPNGGDDEPGFVFSRSSQHPGADKALDRAEVREDGIREVVAAIAVDTSFSSVPLPNANDLTGPFNRTPAASRNFRPPQVCGSG